MFAIPGRLCSPRSSYKNLSKCRLHLHLRSILGARELTRMPLKEQADFGQRLSSIVNRNGLHYGDRSCVDTSGYDGSVCRSGGITGAGYSQRSNG